MKRGRKSMQPLAMEEEMVVGSKGTTAQTVQNDVLSQSKGTTEEEWRDQQKVLVECFQAITLKEAVRSKDVPSASTLDVKIPTIHTFLELNPDTFHG